MSRINSHPILDTTASEPVTFLYEGKEVHGEKGYTIAAALHQAGHPVHSHSLRNRNRSLECGIGKCGACEMLVDGEIKRICITKVDGVKEVTEIPKNYMPTLNGQVADKHNQPVKIYKTTVAIIGAGPAGLACRDELNKRGVDNLVIDNNEHIGGQFLMQTHQFFFFEKQKEFGGMRGFEIAKTLAGEDSSGILLSSVVWDILEGNRLAVKNIRTEEIFYVDTEHLVIATGAVPYMPTFRNDDLPGVYTAAVVQKMMNQEFTLLGKNVLTIGAGNIGYLTSYQLMQAGAKVKAIVEAMSKEGGFPVQANRVRRLGIPIILSHMLMEAIPNDRNDGIVGAVIAECKDFKPIPGTEKVIEGIDAINICTGLVPDDSLLIKGKEVFGLNCFGAGDAIRIGEGTSAVVRGRQVAYEILEHLRTPYAYDDYLRISKEYIDSQQHPVRVIETPSTPTAERAELKAFPVIDCLYGFACNPCTFACPNNAITKNSTSDVPKVDYDKCTGCMECVYQCPGLAIFGMNPKAKVVFLPIEFAMKAPTEVFLVDNDGKKIGEGTLQKVLSKPNKTNVAMVKVGSLDNHTLTDIRGFIVKADYPTPLEFKPFDGEVASESFICHCDDVTLTEVLDMVGDRAFISVDEIKHTTRLGMGACRGKRCLSRLKPLLRAHRIQLVGEATPRGPLSNQITMGDLTAHYGADQPVTRKVEVVKVDALVAGGGMGGSSVFRYLSEAGKKATLLNWGHGSSWRNIAGGRPAFSVPELSEIAHQNLALFRELHEIRNVDLRQIEYVSFAHDEASKASLEGSMAWQDAFFVEPKDFATTISPHINPRLKTYKGALISRDCWQATPGKVLDLIRRIGIEAGGTVQEDARLVHVTKEGLTYRCLVQMRNRSYVEYQTPVFVNALGAQADPFIRMLDIKAAIVPVKHQAFITRRLPMLGVRNEPLGMLIDRREYKGFVAVYGQQLAETGQIIGCASPQVEGLESGKNLKINSRAFLEVVSEVFADWIPDLSSVGFQAVWAGYYAEPRMVLDPEAGLFVGMRGQGFMLSQYLGKLYVDKLLGREYPAYFDRLALSGDGMLEKAFK
jgi:glycine/D-amino acid oxidase-like deaminating enzyme/Fe-S-cluster-containing hydrogenase component 2/bacterioferritin-associated ferredoxin